MEVAGYDLKRFLQGARYVARHPRILPELSLTVRRSLKRCNCSVKDFSGSP